MNVAQPVVFEPVAAYRPWSGRVDYDPNMRRVLVRRGRTLSLLYLVSDSKTPVGTVPLSWRVAAFGPCYGVRFTPALGTLWDAHTIQLERRVHLEHDATLGMEARLVSDSEAHHLVLLLISLEPRNDLSSRKRNQARPIP
ncbi:MAG: hypothetical protein HC933_00855 [Pleurocapsa sp. SU_196_0]|nr:hypothetical protein [Pleurocapsa sp. SU_196_0]